MKAETVALFFAFLYFSLLNTSAFASAPVSLGELRTVLVSNKGSCSPANLVCERQEDEINK